MIDVLLGLQWGDEGKGKIVDLISKDYDVVARFGGGCNAGHTLVFNGQKHVLHLIPSGIFHNCMNVIGNGCVIDPINLMGEINKLEKMGIDVKSKLFISNKAHVTLPIHIVRDKISEEIKGDNKIGSTLKGIGPTYTSKTKRDGFRISDYNKDNIIDILNIDRHVHYNFLLGNSNKDEIINEIHNNFIIAMDFLTQYKIINTERYLNKALQEGKNILAEGAQGTLLDIDFGTYPFVTSSNTCIGGVMTGLGVPPQSIRNVIGITKAYCTRVGSGPFTTEEFGKYGEQIRKVGNEFGSTTGRPRRCGWLNLDELQYSCMINGATELCLMKIDVLSGMDKIYVGIGNFDDGTGCDLAEFEGWTEDLSKIKTYDNLPENCKKMISFIQDYIKVKITKISVGSDREETIFI